MSSRAIQDAKVNPAAFALPSSASSSTTSAWIDLGVTPFQGGDFELRLDLPALSTTIAPDTRTVTLSVETSANATTVIRTLGSEVYTGAGGTGIAAQTLRSRVPSDCERYARFKVTFGASTTDGSALSATGTVRF